MKLEELTTIDQLSQFLDGTQSVIFMLSNLKIEEASMEQEVSEMEIAA